jgi:imidazolonepropionase-like amidohydrolase
MNLLPRRIAVFSLVVSFSVIGFAMLTAQTNPTTAAQGQAQGARAGGQGAGRGQGRGGGSMTLIKAARVLDGLGKVLENSTVLVQGNRIISVGAAPAPDPQATPPTVIDLGNVTLMPGMIDVHVHLNWYFGPNGKYNEPNVPADYPAQAYQANARATLMAGFTTVQSVGWAQDKPLKEAIAAGLIVGPRIVTSLSQITAGNNATPDSLRERVRQAKAQGADLIKFFASGSIRDGGKMNVTQEQVDAVCGEAKAQGLRTLVHAHDSPSIIASVKAGCTQIEHGMFADDAAVKAMKDANVYFDPNIGLVLQNYIENKDKYMGSGNFNEEGFASMEKVLPTVADSFKRALRAGVKMPMGTDAVAGGHGQNAREIIARVGAGQKPMDAIIGATSLAAESMGMEKQFGSLVPGLEADIVAVSGNPLTDINKVRDVVFVMKGGRVFKK